MQRVLLDHFPIYRHCFSSSPASNYPEKNIESCVGLVLVPLRRERSRSVLVSVGAFATKTLVRFLDFGGKSGFLNDGPGRNAEGQNSSIREQVRGLNQVVFFGYLLGDEDATVHILSIEFIQVASGHASHRDGFESIRSIL